MSEPIMTNVLGYFNPHDYPIQISVSALSMQIRLAPKQFILDREKRKINDPVFEGYCGPYKLAKEATKKSVPIIFVKKPEQSINDSRMSFAASPTVVTDALGNVTDLPKKQAAPAAGASTNSVKGFSVAEAVKRGIIRNPIVDRDAKEKPVKPAKTLADLPVEDLGDKSEPVTDLAEVVKKVATKVAQNKEVDISSDQVLPVGAHDKTSLPKYEKPEEAAVVNQESQAQEEPVKKKRRKSKKSIEEQASDAPVSV